MIILKALATLSLYPAIETTDLARWALFSTDMPDKVVETYRSKMNDESFRTYMDELGLNLVHPKRIKTSLLVIGAENDAVIKPSTVRHTAKIYGTEAKVFPNMAHDIMLESGWEQIAETILKWLNEKGL